MKEQNGMYSAEIVNKQMENMSHLRSLMKIVEPHMEEVLISSTRIIEAQTSAEPNFTESNRRAALTGIQLHEQNDLPQTAAAYTPAPLVTSYSTRYPSAGMMRMYNGISPMICSFPPNIPTKNVNV